MNTGAGSYSNVDVMLLGNELGAVYSFGRRLFLPGGHQHVRGRPDPRPELNIYSENRAEMPPLTGRAAVRFDTGRWWAEVVGVAAGAQRCVDTDLCGEPTAGYAIGNLGGGSNIRQFIVVARLNNILDRNFYEHLSYLRDPFRSGVHVREPSARGSAPHSLSGSLPVRRSPLITMATTLAGSLDI